MVWTTSSQINATRSQSKTKQEHQTSKESFVPPWVMVLLEVWESGWLAPAGGKLPLRATWRATNMSAFSKFTSSSCLVSFCCSCFWNSSLQDNNSASNCLTFFLSWESFYKQSTTIKINYDLFAWKIWFDSWPTLFTIKKWSGKR